MAGDEAGPADWRTTQWSVVLSSRQAGAGGAGAGMPGESRAGLEQLCQTYWYPLYAYLRRKGYRAEDTADLVQGFFVALIEKDFLDAVDPERGRFRWFLMKAASRFAANWTKAQTRQKRGGGQQIWSLDFSEGETRFAMEPADDQTAEKLFERRWALTVLESALGKLADSYEADGKQRYFDTLKVYLSGDQQAPPYAESAEKLGIAETTVKVAIHRLREKYRGVIRQIVADTLDHREDLDDEINALLASLG